MNSFTEILTKTTLEKENNLARKAYNSTVLHLNFRTMCTPEGALRIVKTQTSLNMITN